MKKSFSDLCKSPFLLTFFVAVGVVGLFEFVIWPGLTVANTFSNILSAIFGVLTFGFVFYFVKNTWYDEKDSDIVTLFNVDQNKEPETELDYNPSTTKGKRPIKKTAPIKEVKTPKPKTKKPKKNGKV